MAALPSPFRLTDRLVDPALNRVTMPTGETVQVEPKIMLVLTVLAEHPSEVVTREDLMSRVWNGVFVTDDVLHRAIRELRRIFDDDSEAPRVIETIRKRGYRLIGPIETVGEVAGTGAARRAGGARRTTPVLAAIACAAVIVVTLIWLGRRPGTIDTEARVRFMPLTSEPGNEVDPALSSSGRLAYVARGDDGRSHLFTKVSADATAAQITRGDGTDRAPTWSPDESRVAFVRMDAAGCAISDRRSRRTRTPDARAVHNDR